MKALSAENCKEVHATFNSSHVVDSRFTDQGPIREKKLNWNEVGTYQPGGSYALMSGSTLLSLKQWDGRSNSHRYNFGYLKASTLMAHASSSSSSLGNTNLVNLLDLPEKEGFSNMLKIRDLMLSRYGNELEFSIYCSQNGDAYVQQTKGADRRIYSPRGRHTWDRISSTSFSNLFSMKKFCDFLEFTFLDSDDFKSLEKRKAIFSASVCIIALLGPGLRTSETISTDLMSLKRIQDMTYYVLFQPKSAIVAFNRHLLLVSQSQEIVRVSASMTHTLDYASVSMDCNCTNDVKCDRCLLHGGDRSTFEVESIADRCKTCKSFLLNRKDFGLCQRCKGSVTTPLEQFIKSYGVHPAMIDLAENELRGPLGLSDERIRTLIDKQIRAMDEIAIHDTSGKILRLLGLDLTAYFNPNEMPALDPSASHRKIIQLAQNFKLLRESFLYETYSYKNKVTGNKQPCQNYFDCTIVHQYQHCHPESLPDKPVIDPQCPNPKHSIKESNCSSCRVLSACVNADLSRISQKLLFSLDAYREKHGNGNLNVVAKGKSKKEKKMKDSSAQNSLSPMSAPSPAFHPTQMPLPPPPSLPVLPLSLSVPEMAAHTFSEHLRSNVTPFDAPSSFIVDTQSSFLPPPLFPPYLPGTLNEEPFPQYPSNNKPSRPSAFTNLSPSQPLSVNPSFSLHSIPPHPPRPSLSSSSSSYLPVSPLNDSSSSAPKRRKPGALNPKDVTKMREEGEVFVERELPPSLSFPNTKFNHPLPGAPSSQNQNPPPIGSSHIPSSNYAHYQTPVMLTPSSHRPSSAHERPEFSLNQYLLEALDYVNNLMSLPPSSKNYGPLYMVINKCIEDLNRKPTEPRIASIKSAQEANSWIEYVAEQISRGLSQGDQVREDIAVMSQSLDQQGLSNDSLVRYLNPGASLGVGGVPRTSSSTPVPHDSSLPMINVHPSDFNATHGADSLM